MSDPKPGNDPLAIICGGGSFPGAVAAAVAARGRQPVMFGIKGWADPAVIERYTYHWISIGQVGRFFRSCARRKMREVLFIGACCVRRYPRFVSIGARLR